MMPEGMIPVFEVVVCALTARAAARRDPAESVNFMMMVMIVCGG
jgi:hypothetical protein